MQDVDEVTEELVGVLLHVASETVPTRREPPVKQGERTVEGGVGVGFGWGWGWERGWVRVSVGGGEGSGVWR